VRQFALQKLDKPGAAPRRSRLARARIMGLAALEIDRGRRPRRAAQCRQIDLAVPRVACPPQDRRLSLYDTPSAARRRAPRRRHRIRHGRFAGVDRRRQRGSRSPPAPWGPGSNHRTRPPRNRPPCRSIMTTSEAVPPPTPPRNRGGESEAEPRTGGGSPTSATALSRAKRLVVKIGSALLVGE